MKKSHKIQEKIFKKDGTDYELRMIKEAKSPLLTTVVLVEKQREPDTGGWYTVTHKFIYRNSFTNQDDAHAVYQEILRRASDK